MNILMSIRGDENDDIMRHLNDNPSLKIITAALYSYFWDKHRQARDNKIEKGAISVENALKGHTFLEEAKKRNYNINIDIKEI